MYTPAATIRRARPRATVGSGGQREDDIDPTWPASHLTRPGSSEQSLPNPRTTLITIHHPRNAAFLPGQPGASTARH